MATIQPGADGFYHPANEEEIHELIEHAVQKGLIVRVRGAAHSSVNAAIYTGDFEKPPPADDNINSILEKGCRTRSLTIA